MRRFFRSKKFIITSAVALVLVASIIAFTVVGSVAAPQSAFAGSVIAPIQEFFGNVAEGVGNFFGTFANYEKLEQENADLREQISDLVEEKTQWQEALNQNEFYKEFLGIKEDHEDFDMCPARVVSRDAADPFGTFTVNIGSLDGVSIHDPVITAEGIIGYVCEVGPSYATVMTVLNPAVKMGAYDRRSDDSGVVTGDVAGAADGLCRMDGLSRSSTVSKGDYVVTSGGGVFPAGLIVGTIETVVQIEGELSVYAVIAPAADIKACSNVMIITSFNGQSDFDGLVRGAE